MNQHTLYAVGGVLIILGCICHTLNLVWLLELGLVLLLVTNTSGMVLCACGSSNWPHPRYATVLLLTGVGFCVAATAYMMSLHLWGNLAVECAAFALTAVGNYYRMRSYTAALPTKNPD
jgi:hypothetical protein